VFQPYKGVKLDELTPDEVAAVPLAEVIKLRREWFPRAAEQIGDGPTVRLSNGRTLSAGAAIREWATRMEVHGAEVQPWQVSLPWIAALAVVRYGEAPFNFEDGKKVAVWPKNWTEEDVNRAMAWESGEDIPAAVAGARIIRGRGRRLSATLEG
jgi:hypothetical protein